VVDPDGRELVMSCGAAAGTLCVAARGLGLDPSLELLPDGEAGDLLARIELADGPPPTAEEAAMTAAIEARTTSRRSFTGTPLPPELIERLRHVAEARGAWLEPVHDGIRSQIVELVVEGDLRQWRNRRYRRELALWLQPPKAREGLPTPAAGISRLAVRRLDMGKRMAAADRALAERAPLLAVLGTDPGTPRGWFQCGIALAELLLRATASGVSAGFLNQPLQVAALRPVLATAIGRPDGHPLLLLRLGHASGSSRRTGRWPLSEVASGLPG
jgi:nitroreductase family protein